MQLSQPARIAEKRLEQILEMVFGCSKLCCAKEEIGMIPLVCLATAKLQLFSSGGAKQALLNKRCLQT